MLADSLVHQEHNATRINYQISQSDLSGLFLLATFPKPSGDLYVRCGVLMEL